MDRINRSKNALVTGASRGIGKGIALALAADGYNLAITYSTCKEMAEDVAHIIESYGRKCIVYQAQMELEESPRTIVDASVNELGMLDVLVNNAGARYDAEIYNVESEKIDYFLNLDFKSYIMMMKEVSRHMIDNNIRGNVVNITSTRGHRAYPRNSIYCAVKSAIGIATEAAALDLAPYGIRANCIAPGAIRIRDNQSSIEFYENLAPKIPLSRIGTPEDVGNAVSWLVSDKASYVTGVTLRVDGGLILPGMPERANKVPNSGWKTKST